MWVVFNKKDRKIVGLTAISTRDIDKDTALKETIEGALNVGALSEYDALQVTDPLRAEQYMDNYPERLVVTGPVSKPKLVIRDPESFLLYVTCDAPDKHPVDGIPEIKADGTSSALITIQKIDERFKPQKGDADNEELYFRTDHGVLKDEAGKKAISRIKLKKGEAKVRLFSEKVKRVANVQIMSIGAILADQTFRIEFI